jgi:hypothetical protein
MVFKAIKQLEALPSNIVYFINIDKIEAKIRLWHTPCVSWSMLLFAVIYSPFLAVYAHKTTRPRAHPMHYLIMMSFKKANANNICMKHATYFHFLCLCLSLMYIRFIFAKMPAPDQCYYLPVIYSLFLRLFMRIKQQGIEPVRCIIW